MIMDGDEIIRRFNENQTAHLSLMDKIDSFGDKIDEINLNVAKLPDELTRRFDERYATKETEIALKRIMWIIVSAVVVATLSIVIKST